MRVDPRPSGVAAPLASGPTSTARRAGGGAAGAFALSEGEPERPAATSARAAAPLATMDAILALQGETERDPERRRRRSLQRGRDLLDGLDRLKAGLLAGRVGAGDLAALHATLAREAAASGDSGLDEVVAHIDLRAQVELAKLRARPG